MCPRGDRCQPFICVASAAAPPAGAGWGRRRPPPVLPAGALGVPPRPRGSAASEALPGVWRCPSAPGERAGPARQRPCPHPRPSPHSPSAGAPESGRGPRRPASPSGRCRSRGCPCRRDALPRGRARQSRVSRAGVSGAVGRERTRPPQSSAFSPENCQVRGVARAGAPGQGCPRGTASARRRPGGVENGAGARSAGSAAAPGCPAGSRLPRDPPPPELDLGLPVQEGCPCRVALRAVGPGRRRQRPLGCRARRDRSPHGSGLSSEGQLLRGGGSWPLLCFSEALRDRFCRFNRGT
ncbi:unnamed protein product [Coccothraustes coccothraustes]